MNHTPTPVSTPKWAPPPSQWLVGIDRSHPPHDREAQTYVNSTGTKKEVKP